MSLRARPHALLYTLVLIAGFVGGFVAGVRLTTLWHLKGVLGWIVLATLTTLGAQAPSSLYRRRVPAACPQPGCSGRAFAKQRGGRLDYRCETCGTVTTL